MTNDRPFRKGDRVKGLPGFGDDPRFPQGGWLGTMFEDEQATADDLEIGARVAPFREAAVIVEIDGADSPRLLPRSHIELVSEVKGE